MAILKLGKKKEKDIEPAPAPAPERSVPPAPAPVRHPKSPESDVLKKTVMNGSTNLKDSKHDAHHKEVSRMKEKFELRPPKRKARPKIRIKPPKRKVLPKPKVIIRHVREAGAKPHPDMIQKEVDKFIDEVLKNKEKIQELAHMRKELDRIAAKVEGPAFKNLEDIIYSEFDKMNKIINENKDKEKEFAEEMKNEVDAIKKDIDEMKKVEEKMKALDVEGFRRDLESTKQKVKWIQDHIEAFDVMPLIELLKDVEMRVNDLKISSPVIID